MTHDDQTPRSPRLRLISFLGLGPFQAPAPYYNVVRYALDEQLSAPTPLVQQALDELLAPASKTLLLGTQAVQERWLGSSAQGGSAVLDDYLPPARRAFWLIPDGKDQAELDTIFAKVLQALSELPLDELDEQEPPEQIVLDVTHGMRIQPMIGLAAIAFAQSRWARQRPEGVAAPTLRVVYGAFDAVPRGGQQPTPIWELTSFLDVARWDDAINALLRFGRADDLERLARELSIQESATLGRVRGKPSPEYIAAQDLAKWMRILGERAREFADDAATLRASKVVETSSLQLAQHLTKHDAQYWGAKAPLLHEALEALKASASAVHAPQLCSPAGLRALARLAQLALDQGHDQQALTLVNESLFLCWGILREADHPRHVTDQGFEQTLKRWMGEMNSWLTSSKIERADAELPAPLAAVVKLATKIKGVRNDVNHIGLRHNPIKAQTLQKNMLGHVLEFAQLVEAMPEPGSCAPPSQAAPIATRCLANLSNHPVSQWSQAQLDSARERFGQPADVEGWALVDPSATIQDVLRQADALVERVLAMGAKDALILGEPTLSMSLVAMLQAQGVSCWATTTHRRLSPQDPFVFHGWREYPTLARLTR